ncbi:MAG: MoxR family ATPase [Kofleriaceae bacterium]|nr:MoxR family ATPase [Kofleriaceae bacterium]MBP9169860.1 MoxR family ATPase [Kofleriaceae bacterium]MBP9858049.1 MoxR family ATPase [Kofleriaceae bacterium]
MDVPAANEYRTVERVASVAQEVIRFVHVLDRQSALAINAALAARRPLLVRGEPGLGKTQLAEAAAIDLGWEFRPFAVDADTETRDLLYREDLVQRFADAHVERSAPEPLGRERYIVPGPLWWAFSWKTANEQMGRVRGGGKSESVDMPAGTVLLVDEIDKADSSVPNALLEALARRRFDTPVQSVALDDHRPLLVVFTTNEERALPDAFLRRCLVLHLTLPDGPAALTKELIRRGCAHFPDRDAVGVLERAAQIIVKARQELAVSVSSPPGVAEYIDLVDAAIRLDKDGALLEEIAEFAIRKHAPAPRDRDGGLKGLQGE